MNKKTYFQGKEIVFKIVENGFEEVKEKKGFTLL